MANDTLLNVGTGGDTMHTLDRSGVKSPWSLLDISQAGEAELTGLGDSRGVIATSAGLTTATTAYIAGDMLGTELQFASITRSLRGAVVNSGSLVDKAKVLAAVDLRLFDSSVTPAADNAANAWSDADMLKHLGTIHFFDQMISGNNHVLQPTNSPWLVKPASGTTIYGYLVTRTSHTFFGAVGDIQVSLGVARD